MWVTINGTGVPPASSAAGGIELSFIGSSHDHTALLTSLIHQVMGQPHPRVVGVGVVELAQPVDLRDLPGDPLSHALGYTDRELPHQRRHPFAIKVIELSAKGPITVASEQLHPIAHPEASHEVLHRSGQIIETLGNEDLRA